MNEHIQEVNGESIWPQLYALASTGKVKTWQIKVRNNGDGTATVTSTFGQHGGKLQDKVEIIREGKNLGRANETTPHGQALSEAASDFQRKLDKKYTETIPGAMDHQEADILLPMLALDFRKRAHDIVYPAYGQPKLNGVRCLTEKVSDREIRFTSRKNKPFPEEVTAHLVQPLLQVMERGEIKDGEFYVHDWSFQQITRTVKKARPWARELQYHIFDIADKAATWGQRRQELLKARQFNTSPELVKFVDDQLLQDATYVKLAHDFYVGHGYEGVIIRNAAGLYVFDHRSKDLQKYKEFIDAEFEIVGGDFETVTDPATHAEVKAVVFTCVTPEGYNFNVRPKGTVAFRARLYANLPDLLGRFLTVRYQELSTENSERGTRGGLPIFPVGLAIRDYE